MWTGDRSLILPSLLPVIALLGAATLGLRPAEVGAAPALVRQLERLPLTFLENRGQAGEEVAFYALGQEAGIAFSRRGVTYSLEAQEPEPAGRQHVIRQEFVGGASVEPVGVRPSAAKTSFFRGKRSEWRTGMHSFETVRFPSVWPGIDAEYSGGQDRVKAEFLVAPGANPEAVRLAYRGASKLEVDASGQLAISTPVRMLIDERPEAYQEIDGRRVAVSCGYRLLGGCEYAFTVGRYDRAHPLVIDPSVLVYCGFLGGQGTEFPTSAAVDAQGNLYVTGDTTSFPSSFPVQVGPFVNFSGQSDVFVAKVNADGTALDYCGYIGGASVDNAEGIAVDSSGNAYVVGSTDSTEDQGFPVQGAFDSLHNGGRDAFIAKVNPEGTALDYCGFLGGTRSDAGRSVALDGAGNLYLCGITNSTELQGFPLLNGPDLTYNSDPNILENLDGFVAKIDATGGSLVYCGYIGGALRDTCEDIAVSSAGICTVVGITRSAQDTFPETGGPDLTANGGDDGFVARLNAAGQRVSCGFFGGNGFDILNSVALDSAGNAYLGGSTSSAQSTFPLLTGPDLTHNGSLDGFVAKLQPNGTTLAYCGYLGGLRSDFVNSIAVDADRSLILLGETESTQADGFPLVDGPDFSHNGGIDVFVAKVNDGGSAILLSSYLGSSAQDSATEVAVAPSGDIHILGSTFGNEAGGFPVVLGPDLTANGGRDAFVAKLVSPPLSPSGASAQVLNEREVQVTWTDRSRNEIGFEVFRRIDDGPLTSVGIEPPNATTFLDLTLEEGASLRYQVRAFNAAGASSLSNAANVVMPHARPLNLRAAILSPTSLRLQWTDDSRHETGFAVERKTGTGSFTRIGTVTTINQATTGSINTFDDTGIVQGTTYTYRVFATGGGVESAPSDPLTVVVNVPPAPTQFAAVATGSRIRLTWNDVSNQELGFRIERKIAGGSFATIHSTGPNETEFTDFGLALETQFTYRIRAFNGVGNGATIQDTAVTLAPPGELKALQTNGIVTLRWGDNSSLEDGFRIDRGNTLLTTVAAGVTTFELGLPSSIPESEHTVTTVKGTDSSDPAPISVNPLVGPRNLRVIFASRTKVDLRFEDPNQGAHQVVVERSIAGSAFLIVATLEGGVLTFSDTQLSPGKPHTYRVRASGAIGTSSASSPATAFPLATPTGLTANAVSSARVNLEWADTNQIEDGYAIERRRKGDISFAALGSVGPNVRTFTDSTVATNQIYDYRVQAVRGTSKEASALSNVKVLAAPSNFDVRTTNGTLEAVWTNNTTLEDGIRLEVQDTSGAFILFRQLAKGTAQALLTNLPPDATVTARVRANATRSLSSPSNTDTIRVPASPAAMEAFAEDSTHVRLKWTDRSEIEDAQELRVREVLSSGFGPWKPIGRVGPNVEEYLAEVSPERRLQFRVRAVVGADVSDWCPVWPIVTT